MAGYCLIIHNDYSRASIKRALQFTMILKFASRFEVSTISSFLSLVPMIRDKVGIIFTIYVARLPRHVKISVPELFYDVIILKLSFKNAYQESFEFEYTKFCLFLDQIKLLII